MFAKETTDVILNPSQPHVQWARGGLCPECSVFSLGDKKGGIMIITTGWLSSIMDEQGFTWGQVYLLKKWAGEDLWQGKEIPDQVANFLEHCKGYRRIPDRIKDLKGWV